MDMQLSKTLAFCTIVLASICGLAGCGGESADAPNQNDTVPRRATVSQVPLRVWVVAPIVEREVVQRKWLGDTPQPIEIKQMTQQELLAGDHCNCDVVVYPSRLMGELVARKWVSKLPRSITDAPKTEDTGGSNSNPIKGLSPVWAAQATFDQDLYALPLGCDVPGLLTTARLEELASGNTTAVTWEHFLSLLPNVQTTIDPNSVDHSALVDRFLAIASTMSERDAKYGLLLQLPKLQPLLSRKPEFERAAKVLLRLSTQTADGALAVGGHSEVWQTITASEHTLASVVPLASLSAEENASKRGFFQPLLPSGSELDQDGESTGDHPGDAAEGRSRPFRSWNVGGGLNVSLADDCSQSAQAANFMKWLAKPQTRTFLANQIPGIQPSSPTDGVDALRWQGISRQSPLVTRALPQELRLPGAHLYRDALAAGLVDYLTGKMDAMNALRQVEAAWGKITRTRPEQITEFKKSLGLL